MLLQGFNRAIIPLSALMNAPVAQRPELRMRKIWTRRQAKILHCNKN